MVSSGKIRPVKLRLRQLPTRLKSAFRDDFLVPAIEVRFFISELVSLLLLKRVMMINQVLVLSKRNMFKDWVARGLE